jgi:transposase
MGTSFAKYRMPAELWARMEKLIPERPRTTPKGGRPPIKNPKSIADGIFYRMRTGCQWNAIPRTFGASSTIHSYFQQWIENGVFEMMWELALGEYDDLVGVAWKDQSIDSATVKSPLGGEKNRAQSNRSRQAWKQTLRPGRRPWRSAVVRDSSSECERWKTHGNDAQEEKVPAQTNMDEKTNSSARRQRLRQLGCEDICATSRLYPRDHQTAPTRS